MKILILDVDQSHNKKLQQVFSGKETLAQYFADLKTMLEVLNGSPLLEQKKKEIEKAVKDAQDLLAKTDATIDQCKVQISEKNGQIAKLAPADVATQKAPLEVAVKDLHGQINKAGELKTKLASVVTTKQNELAVWIEQMPKDDGKKVAVCLVDRGFLGNRVAEWVGEFRQGIQLPDNKEVPLVIMGYNEEPAYIRGTLVPGAQDYFVKPVDILLLRHNVAKLSGKTLEADEKIFELQTISEIKLLKSVTITKMSEFTLDVQSTMNFGVGEFVEFMADLFNMSKGGRLLGRCLSCSVDPANKSAFVAQFSFVGLSAHSMNELRKWIKLQYVAQKNKGE